jgi:hypothetical protein
MHARIWVEKPVGKRPLGRHRRRWEDTIKIDLEEVGCGGMDWIDVSQDKDRWWALVNAVMKIRVHKMRVLPRLAENGLASVEGFRSME